MNSPFVDTILNLHYLEENLLDILIEKTEIIEFPARYKLIKSGFIAKRIFFVEKGAIRSYHLKDGNEIATWFTFENEFITSFYSFISHKPCHETIELLEDSILHALTFDDLNALTIKYPEINHLYRKVLELNFVKQERKLNERFDSAKDKYQNLMSKYPEILQRVPLGYIASYLGITQSTLSRIRKK